MRRRTLLAATTFGFAAAAAAQVGTNTFPTGVRRGHVMAYDTRRREVLVFGGLDPAPDSGIEPLWIRTAAGAWRQAASVSGNLPGARSLPASAYDSRRDKFVVYGGLGGAWGNRYGDTWEWNGVAWKELRFPRGAPLPGPRDHHAMVYDSARERLVMHGGSVFISVQTSSGESRNGSQLWYEETWEFDGTAWKGMPGVAPAGPGTRAHHCMAYDPIRKMTVLLGGVSEDRQRSRDTWGWDGSAWKRLAEGGPAPRPRSRMAFHEPSGELVLYGGDIPHAGTGFKLAGDTWTWNGKEWTERKPRNSPGERFMHAMAYETEGKRVILYGGVFGAKERDDAWFWDGENWTPMT